MFETVTKKMGNLATIAAATLALAGCSEQERQNTASSEI
jgi:outer membrane murein-binding lipoprotein Lpp